ncbi:hypothetical protein I4U23_004606 [Adineta vaga]|nr:hypothetical protein I4U23_004606 [Adineta vaga]
MDRVIELGSTYFDTADVYDDNEDLLGKYFKKYPQQRQKVFLATKFAGVINPVTKTYTDRGDAQYIHEACVQIEYSRFSSDIENMSRT